jgi:hypothetical protein
MIAFDEMLVKPAEEAGIKVPSDLENYDANEYPHWKVFCNVQLGSPMPNWTAHWENAKMVAGVSTDKIKTIKMSELMELGLQIGFSTP